MVREMKLPIVATHPKWGELKIKDQVVFCFPPTFPDTYTIGSIVRNCLIEVEDCPEDQELALHVTEQGKVSLENVGKRPVFVNGLHMFPGASIEHVEPATEFTLGATNLNLSMSMMDPGESYLACLWQDNFCDDCKQKKINDCTHQTEGKLIKERLEAALKEGQSSVLNQNELKAYPPLLDTATEEEESLDQILQTDKSQYSFRPLQSFTTPMCERCANKLWPSPGTLYKKCKTCEDLILCPLCVIYGGHRKHELLPPRDYDEDLKAVTEYTRQAVLVRDDLEEFIGSRGMDKDVLTNAINIVTQAKKCVQSLVASAKNDLENAMMMPNEPGTNGDHDLPIVKSITDLETKLAKMTDAITPIERLIEKLPVEVRGQAATS